MNKLRLKFIQVMTSGWKMVTFTCLLILYLITEGVSFLEKRVAKLFKRQANTQPSRLMRFWQPIYSRAIRALDAGREKSISKIINFTYRWIFTDPIDGE